ncbi:ABC transporter ATP-binding protein [Desulfosporosinus youngiae]|uniref:ABC-type cobalamin/Fe3+-siderophore transport system, ATPase component n=1 Tax=Desulfosporosinus youngiae DSM 17734 TaxID=768710 RepID=H5Y280_9FIRM|nr:ABC transporter ATP-binding protein [Desulfosporosinus youngiae]EHQ88428.1 ABC-type cobalamin/Fe3+-siderophore transport system, ATPase component [Desulfosporosinus youngiae DSM 17734]
MIRVNNLSFSYQKSKRSHKIFDGLSLTFAKGLNVILGPNGAGKSTLLKSIFGLLNYHGNILYGTESITAMNTEEKIKLMSYLPQMDVEISTLTVLEMVILGRLPELGYKVTDEDLNIVMDTLESLNITALATRNFSELSGGQKKLVFIAQTLVRKPKLILLDEPVNSLDLQKQVELCQLLQKIVDKQKVDIIVVLHDINLAARYAQHIVVMDEKGSVYSTGKPGDIIKPQMLEEVYGVIANVTYDEQGIPMVSPLCSVRKV